MKTVIFACLAIVLLGAGLWLWTPDRPLHQLESRYLQGPANMEDVVGTPLRVRDEGPADAPVVFLLHGLGSSLETWDLWAQQLKSSHRVIRIDLPGHGLSGPDLRGDYSDARTLALLVAVMDKRQIGQASFVGNSIGGRIAWTMAAKHPERVNRLVLIAPDGFASPGFDYGKPPQIPAMLSAMEFALPKPLLQANIAAAYADPRKLRPEVVQRYHELMLAPGNRRAMIARMKSTILADPKPYLASIQAPVLLVWGAEDAMIPVSNAQAYLAALPNARLVTLKGIGHVPQEEDPGASLEPVAAFLVE